MKKHSKEVPVVHNLPPNTDSNPLPVVLHEKSCEEESKAIDSALYHNADDFIKKVSLNDNIYISHKPLEECEMCYKKFDLTQFTMIITNPIRARITCGECKLVTYIILSKKTNHQM